MNAHSSRLALIIGIAVLALYTISFLGLRFGRLPPPVDGALVIDYLEFDDLAGWPADDHQQALAVFQRSCAAIAKKSADGPISTNLVDPALDELFGPALIWQSVCQKALAVPPISPAGARLFFEQNFRPVRLSDNKDGLFTGYFEPQLTGSREPVAPYTVPLLGRPNDLVSVDLGAFRPELRGQRIAGRVSGSRLVPFASREDIVSGALDTEALAIAWVDRPADAFFLHIQGSGRVLLPDGNAIRVGYDGQNGHPYTAIGRVLIERGELTREEVSLQSIRAWLESNPAEADEVMSQNASYVFFRELDVPDPTLGPLGAQGVQLTPERSLAVDLRHYPLGAPIWIDVETPPQSDGAAALKSLFIAQDTGGAIRGLQRADVFWGFGPEPERIAGLMKHPGSMIVLVPRASPPLEN